MNLMNPFEQTLSKKLRNEERERQLLAKFLADKREQIGIADRVPLVLIDADSPRRKLYKIMLDMQDENKDINFHSVKDQIDRKIKASESDDMFEELGLLTHTDHYDSVENIAETLDIHYKNRVVFHDIIKRAQEGFNADVDPNTLLEDIAKTVAGSEAKIAEKSFKDLVKEAKRRLLNPTESERGLKTGLDAIDNNFGGMIKDRYWTIGAESGIGKTAFLVNLIVRICQMHKDKISIIFFSMEMSEERIIERIVSCMISMSSFKMNGRAEPLTVDEIHIIEQGYAIIEDWPLTLLYGTQTFTGMRKTFRKFAMDNQGKHLVGLVDHIGKVEGHPDIRQLTIAASQACKSFCMDYKATMLVLTQLKKELSERNPINIKSHHRPNMSHILESGNIRNDSDNIMFLWRPETREEVIQYGPDASGFTTTGKTILIIEKNRDGHCPIDVIMLSKVQYNQYENCPDPFKIKDNPFEDNEYETAPF